MQALVQSLQNWLIFGGAAFAAVRLHQRCGDIAVQTRPMAVLVPLAITLPVGVLLVTAYRRESRMDPFEAVGRAVLLTLLGAASYALFYSCDF